MKYNLGDLVSPASDHVSPIYRGTLNEFGEDCNQKFVPKNLIGTIKGIRTRYSGTENEYNQYYISFLNREIKLDDCNNLYNDFDLKSVINSYK